MLPILRTASRPVRSPLHVLAFVRPLQSKRLASDYGSKQSGMEEGIDQKNPKADLEHPGPPAPDVSKGDSKSDTESPSQSGGQSGGESGGKSESTSQGGSPAIHRPPQPAQKDDPEVRKHNEEMENRHERSENQLDAKGNRVE